MNGIVKPASILMVITVVAGMCLGLISEVTKGPIAAQTKKTQDEAMAAVLPSADEFKLDEAAPLSGTVKGINVAYKGGEICGYVINVQPSGFGGGIDTMVGINTEGVVEGVKILSLSETPGLGAIATEPEFYNQYAGKSSMPLTVIKSGTPGDSEIQAITSATITSAAITDGVNEAYEWFKKNGGAK